jgi:hypothetical protein
MKPMKQLKPRKPPKQPNNPRKIPYRSGLEVSLSKQLIEAGVPFRFEPDQLPYIRNGKVAWYTPDFKVADGTYLEGKGYFHGGDKDRQKLILIKNQHPEIDLRIVFQKESTPVSKDTTLTYGDWADTCGFTWAGGGKIPQDWLEDFKGTKH